MNYLDLAELLHIADRTLPEVQVRDVGLLVSALARPRATAFGEDAYPTVHEKAAALLHSLARNQALVDGNKRLALAGLLTFLGVNGWRLTLDDDGAYDRVVAVAAGDLDDVQDLARRLRAGTGRRPPSCPPGSPGGRPARVSGAPRGAPTRARLPGPG